MIELNKDFYDKLLRQLLLYRGWDHIIEVYATIHISKNIKYTVSVFSNYKLVVGEVVDDSLEVKASLWVDRNIIKDVKCIRMDITECYDKGMFENGIKSVIKDSYKECLKAIKKDALESYGIKVK